jgi:two-component system nitrogen regulation response regulator NtrX
VLRALQEQMVQPVGGTAMVKVDVRVIAATNKDLQEEIRAGPFREDLYFRLNVVPIFVPPLRDRVDDVIRLAEHFMATLAGEYGRRVKRFAPEALARLQHHGWPGNVRELHNVVERLLIMVQSDTITLHDVGFVGDAPIAAQAPAGPPALTLADARDRFERDYILQVLALNQGNISRTADALGVERSNLYKKMRGFGIAPTRREAE